MSRIVHAVHPVPARVVPPGHRTERLTLLRESTPVRLAEVDPFEMDPGPQFVVGSFGTREPRIHAGALWMRIEKRATPHSAGIPLLPDELEQWLESPAHDWLVRSDLGRFLDGTPLVGCLRSEVQPRGSGEPLPPGTTVVEADRERAAADVVAFVGTDLLVAGRECFMRLDGPLCRLDGFYGEAVMTFLSRDSSSACVAPADEATALWRTLAPPGWAMLHDPGRNLDDHVDGGLAAVMPYLGRGAWETRFANAAPLAILQGAEAALRRPQARARAEAAGLGDGVTRLRRWSALGMTGSVSAAEVPEVASDCRDFLSAMLMAVPGAANGNLAGFASFLEARLMPALEAPAPDGEDALALEGIVP